MSIRVGPVPRWGLARVRGDSMRPGLAPGDRLLVDYRRGPRVDDRVVVRFKDGTVAVKRIVEPRPTAAGDPGWWVLSDDPDRGVDSRHRGTVAKGDVVAVVVARVWPLRRRRAVPDSRRG